MSLHTLIQTVKSVTGFQRGEEHRREKLPLDLEIGDALSFNEAPFIVMGAGGLGVSCPEGRLRVAAHGQSLLRDQHHHRFLLNDGRSLLHVTLDRPDAPPGVRLFQIRDEINPASREEWAFWLDDRDGYIGYPVFQTPDGAEYTRVWNPGATRIAPMRMSERLRYLEGTRVDSRTVDHTTMLYQRTSGGFREYLLVSAVDGGQEAWVEVLLGVDLDPFDITR